MAIVQRKMKFCGALVAGALMTLAAMGAARGEEPAVLSQVPGDANAVIVVNNVKTLSTKLSNAITRLNLPIPLPPDLAGFALRNIGVTEGFDQNSSAALVVLKPAAEGDTVMSGPPRVIVLLPTTDSKAMLANLSPTAPDAGGISEVTLPGDAADKGYVANVDKWVALSQDKETLTAYLAHKGAINKTLSPEAIKTFSDNDLVVWANVAGLSTGLDKFMEDKQQEFTGMMDLANLNKNQDPTMGAIQKEMVNVYFTGVKQYLKDAATGMFTVRLTDAGVSLGSVSTFKAESPFGKFVASQKPAGPLTLAGLPTGEFLVAGSFAANGQAVADLVDTVGKQVLSNEVIAQDAKIDSYKQLLQKYHELAVLVTGGRGVLLDPPAGGKGGIFNGAFVLDTTDPQKYVSLLLETLKNPVTQQGMNPDMKQTVTVSEAAVTIKDVTLTKIHMGFTLREETPDKPLNAGSKQGFEMIQKMYGPEGVTAYMGMVGKKVLFIYGSDGPTMEAAVAAAQSDADNLSGNATISAVKDQIVANPVVVAYFPVAKFVQLAQGMMNPEGAGAAAAPAAGGASSAVLFSAGVSGTTLTAEYHVPIAAITSTIEAVTKMKQAMQGGATPPMQP